METTQTRISITWRPATGNFDSYVVTFAAGGDSEEVVATVPRGSELIASVDELNPGTTYTFNVSAVLSTGNEEIRSAPSTRDIVTS